MLGNFVDLNVDLLPNLAFDFGYLGDSPHEYSEEWSILDLQAWRWLWA